MGVGIEIVGKELEMVLLAEVEVELELRLVFFWMMDRVSLRKMRVVGL